MTSCRAATATTSCPARPATTVLVGENGDDQLSGGDGDYLSGDAGNDVSRAAMTVTSCGGDGDDTLDGGDGNDFLSDFVGTNSFAGGLGDDQIIAGSSDGAQTIDGGDGNDTIRHYYRTFASTITTGSGSDTIELAHANQGTAAIIVTDFTTGAGGDMFRLVGRRRGAAEPALGLGRQLQPVRLGLPAAAAERRRHRAPMGPGRHRRRLELGDAGRLPEHRLPATSPTPISSPATIPTDPRRRARRSPAPAGDDTLTGTIGDDTINALGGDDIVFGLAGADLIYGGDGFDNLNGEDGRRRHRRRQRRRHPVGRRRQRPAVRPGRQRHPLRREWRRPAVGRRRLDSLAGDAGNDIIAGGNEDDVLFGGEGDDGLDGGDGDDFLLGGSGSDVLTGGAGADVFDFQSASEGPDEITDFVSGTDKIQVSASGFGGGLIAGGAVSLVSGTDPTASDASGQFLYDTDDGRLLWDADGTGSGDAVLVATLSNIPSLAGFGLQRDLA